MVTNRWKFIGKTNNAEIFVDYGQRKTKIVTNGWVYIHNGIYPFHNYDSTRRFKR